MSQVLGQYQAFIKDYSDSYGLSPDDASETQTMGYMGEVGEIIELIKKDLRDNHLDKDLLIGELGDELAYMSLYANESGFNYYDIDDTLLHSMIISKCCVPSHLDMCRTLYLAVGTTLIQPEVKYFMEVFEAIIHICNYYEIDFWQIFIKNHNKLLKRWEEGKQRGSGSNR